MGDGLAGFVDGDPFVDDVAWAEDARGEGLGREEGEKDGEQGCGPPLFGEHCGWTCLEVFGGGDVVM